MRLVEAVAVNKALERIGLSSCTAGRRPALHEASRRAGAQRFQTIRAGMRMEITNDVELSKKEFLEVLEG